MKSGDSDSETDLELPSWLFLHPITLPAPPVAVPGPSKPL